MGFWRRLWLVAVLLIVGQLVARADNPPHLENRNVEFIPRDNHTDILPDTAQLNRTDRLYDSIEAITDRTRVTRELYRALFRRPHRDTTTRGRVQAEADPLRPYTGRRINAIHIERLHPFNKEGNWWERAANNLHTLTRSKIIHRDLLFKVGDRLDPELVARNKLLLQSRRYIADVDVRIDVDTLDTTGINVVIRSRDSWTIDADASLHSGGEFSFGLSELNLWGMGHEVRLETGLNYRDFGYGGNIFEYRIPNLLGSFYEFDFSAGRSFEESRFRLSLRKDFLKSTDYEFGIAYDRTKVEHPFFDRDTSELVNSRRFDLWGGYARYIPAWRASWYLTSRYQHRNYTLRPAATGPEMHPALHDRELLLAAVGLYRERVYSATMIYGYGRREYLSSGFRAELTGGYCRGEYGNKGYLGFSYTMGGFTPIGYLMGRADFGSYIDEQNAWRPSALDLQVRGFSNLFRMRRTNIRQFLGVSYTQGWGRLGGADEWIRFTDEAGLSVLDEQVLGTTRLVANSETVFFTPYEPLGFKMALFTFLDAGWLGYHDNVFKNDPYFSLGVGLRVRNERLVFRTLQIRLGVAFGGSGWAKSEWIHLSSEPDLQQYRYTPQRPEELIYR